MNHALEMNSLTVYISSVLVSSPHYSLRASYKVHSIILLLKIFNKFEWCDFIEITHSMIFYYSIFSPTSLFDYMCYLLFPGFDMSLSHDCTKKTRIAIMFDQKPEHNLLFAVDTVRVKILNMLSFLTSQFYWFLNILH